MRDRVSFGYFCENISAVEIVSHRNGDVGGPFFSLSRESTETPRVINAPPDSAIRSRGRSIPSKMLFKIPGAVLQTPDFPLQ